MMSMTLEGSFQITGWDEATYAESDDGAKKTHAKITQSYSGAIEGNSELQYLMSYQSKDSAVFVGIETLTGSVNGKVGSFSLQHTGTFENGVASSRFTIIANSGKGELADIAGDGSFRSGAGGQAQYELTVNQ